MDYVNFLRLLPAARIPLDRTERGEGDPIVLVGGDCARINPAPLAAWVDVFAMGDAEKIVPSLADVLRRDLSREATLAALAELKGLYVPAVHGARAEGAEDGKIVVQQFKAGRGRAPRAAAHDAPHAAHRALGQAPHRDRAGLLGDVPLLLGRLRDGPAGAGDGRGGARDRPPEPPPHVTRGPHRDGRRGPPGDPPDPARARRRSITTWPFRP